MRIGSFLLLLLIQVNSFGQHVFFGERNLDSTEWMKNPLVCFDKNGWIYPDFFIADSAFRNSNNNLKDFYLKHPFETKTIFLKYKMSTSHVLLPDLLALNQRIIAENCKKISLLNSTKISFYIHGFRKSFLHIENGISSPEEAENLRSFMLKEGKETPIVAIYWDGLYDCCYSLNRKRNQELFDLFEKAYAQSLEVGKGVAQFFLSVEQENMLVIAHSLGNRMYLSAVSSFNGTSFFSQHSVKSLLIAPATSIAQMSESFENASTNPDFWNSKWNIVYNKHDFALRKKDSKFGVFGPGAKQFGATTLGCNKSNELTKYEKQLKTSYPKFDFDLYDAREIGKKHSLHFYCDFLKTNF